MISSRLRASLLLEVAGPTEVGACPPPERSTRHVPPNVSKFNLPTVPSNPALKSAKSKPAGGAVNSRLAMEAIRVSLGKHAEIRMLDANAPDPLIQSEVPQPIRYLGLRSCPWNYVFGTGEDKADRPSSNWPVGGAAAAPVCRHCWLARPIRF